MIRWCQFSHPVIAHTRCAGCIEIRDGRFGWIDLPCVSASDNPLLRRISGGAGSLKSRISHDSVIG
ncbi:MAG: hypothetical protein CMJ21_02235 [Phycisphaerae bacterium]|nr:hypothetical protein [Phycisphaerae bacterium]